MKKRLKEPMKVLYQNQPERLMDKLQQIANRDTNGKMTLKVRQLLEEMK